MKRLLILGVGLATIVAGLAASAHATILTHRYDFEGNANDSAGSLDGTVATGDNAPSYDTTSFKSGRSSLLAAKAGSWVSMPSYNFGNQFSIAAWIKPSTTETGPNIQSIVANSGAGWGRNGFRFYFNHWNDNDNAADRAVVVEVGDGTNGNEFATSGGVITEGSWNFVVLTADKTANAFKLYVNGDQKASGSLGIDFNTSNVWTIGSFPGQSAGLFHGGNTDDVQIYSGVLTPEQVSYLNDHPGRVAPEPSTLIPSGGAARPVGLRLAQAAVDLGFMIYDLTLRADNGCRENGYQLIALLRQIR